MTEVLIDDVMAIGVATLLNHPLFSSYSEKQLSALVRGSTLSTYQANEVIVTEGDLVDSVFFVLFGACEVRKNVPAASTAKPDQELPIATLRGGESIGLSPTGVYSTTGTRTASVAAVVPDVMILRISVERLHRFFREHPLPNDIVTRQLDLLRRMQFIKSVAPFSSISLQHVRAIVERIQEVNVPANTTIFEQGDEGDACYIVVSGGVHVLIRASDGESKAIAQLSQNSLFGEAALLNNAPRNATVRTTKPTVLLKIDRALFNDITQKHTSTHQALMNMQFTRCRPKRASGIDQYAQTTSDGEAVMILRNLSLGAYIQLSEQGLFLWNALDGDTTINQLVMMFYEQFEQFNPDDVANQIMALHQSGFVQLNLHEHVVLSEGPQPMWVKLLNKVRAVMEYRVALGNTDAWITKVYQRVGWFFFTRPAQVITLLVVTLGFIAYVVQFDTAIQLLTVSPHKWRLVCVQLFLLALTIPLHEMAHAFATKYCGRSVNSFGIGWLWLGPFAFCDTSDMWLSSKKQKLLVDLAGVYLNAILAGIAGLCAYFTSITYPDVTIVLVLFALSSYMYIITNLNTAFEFDGYYALMDILEKPNLRLASIKWVVSVFTFDKNEDTEHRSHIAFIKHSLTHHRSEVIYCVLTVFYLIVGGVIIPYIVATHLLAGLFGVTNHIVPVLLTALAMISSSVSVYKEVMARVGR